MRRMMRSMMGRMVIIGMMTMTMFVMAMAMFVMVMVMMVMMVMWRGSLVYTATFMKYIIIVEYVQFPLFW